MTADLPAHASANITYVRLPNWNETCSHQHAYLAIAQREPARWGGAPRANRCGRAGSCIT
jgi:hypothetical protein